jgi:hypothetical protein
MNSNRATGHRDGRIYVVAGRADRPPGRMIRPSTVWFTLNPTKCLSAIDLPIARGRRTPLVATLPAQPGQLRFV